MANNRQVLIVAAHPDDETLGMGGAIKVLGKKGYKVNVLFMSSGVGSRNIERQSVDDRKNSAGKALNFLDCTSLDYLDFPDNRFDSIDILDIAKCIKQKIDLIKPELVFTNYYADLNIDHRITSEATQIAVRPQSKSSVDELYFFEVPSSTGWNFGAKVFSPDLYIDISSSIDSKILALNEYKVEIDAPPNARSLEAIRSQAIQRGSHVGFHYAEAFEIGFIRKKY